MNIIEEIKGLKNAVKKQVITYLSAGFGLVSGLAWNDAIKGLIDYIFPQEKDSLTAKFLYALIITLVTAVLLFYLQRLLREEKDNK